MFLLVSSTSHTIIATPTEIYGCGSNQYGQLSLNSTAPQSKFTKIPFQLAEGKFFLQICTALDNTVLLTNHGRLFGSGRNHKGQLGPISVVPCLGFTPIPFDVPGKTIKQVFISTNNLFVLTHDNATSREDIYACGANDYRWLNETTAPARCETFTKLKLELPDQTIKKIICDDYMILILTQQGNLYQHYHSAPYPFEKVKAEEATEQIYSTFSGSLVLTQSKKLSSMGFPWPNLHFPADEIMQQLVISESLDCLLLTQSGKVFSYTQVKPTWAEVQFNLPPQENIVYVNVGSGALFALTSTGTLYGWGKNDQGELGLGHTRNQLIPRAIVQIMQPLLPPPVAFEERAFPLEIQPGYETAKPLAHQIFINSDILSNILSFLSPNSLFKFAQTCKYFHDVIQQRYKIPRHHLLPNANPTLHKIIRYEDAIKYAEQIYDFLPPAEQQAFRTQCVNWYSSVLARLPSRLRLL